MPFSDCLYHVPRQRFWPSKSPMSCEVVLRGPPTSWRGQHPKNIPTVFYWRPKHVRCYSFVKICSEVSTESILKKQHSQNRWSRHIGSGHLGSYKLYTNKDPICNQSTQAQVQASKLCMCNMQNAEFVSCNICSSQSCSWICKNQMTSSESTPV